MWNPTSSDYHHIKVLRNDTFRTAARKKSENQQWAGYITTTCTLCSIQFTNIRTILFCKRIFKRDSFNQNETRKDVPAKCRRDMQSSVISGSRTNSTLGLTLVRISLQSASTYALPVKWTWGQIAVEVFDVRRPWPLTFQLNIGTPLTHAPGERLRLRLCLRFLFSSSEPIRDRQKDGQDA